MKPLGGEGKSWMRRENSSAAESGFVKYNAGIVIGGSVWALVLFGYALLGTRECTSPRRAVSRDHWG
jgi:hypothetical protein